MSVVLNVIIVLGIVIAGSFILFFLGDFLLALTSKKTDSQNQSILQIEHKTENNDEFASSVYVTDYVREEEINEVKEENKEENSESEEEKRIAEARAALERRKAEILKRMQAQIDEDEDDIEEEDEKDDDEDDKEEVPQILGIVNTDEVTAEKEDEDDEEENVDTEALQAEIEQLKNQLGVEREKYDALTKELQNRPQVEVESEKTETLGSREHYENMLEDKLATLKVVEKEFKQCKKDFIPLYKVHNTLAKDEKKLHRKEAIVAKQKVVLYGVNNYADIDEEKAKKLAEDLDLLDGLKLSVNHCKEVMAENKDRYPILEKLYNTLKAQVSTLKSEIEDLKTILANFDGQSENQSSDEE